MKLLLKSMSFKPTAQLKKAIEVQAKRERRHESDVIRWRLLQTYGLIKETPCDSLPS